MCIALLIEEAVPGTILHKGTSVGKIGAIS
jgi:hypothetical protein